MNGNESLETSELDIEHSFEPAAVSATTLHPCNRIHPEGLTDEIQMVEVTQQDARTYFQILRMLGMEEGGDPVQVIQNLLNQQQIVWTDPLVDVIKEMLDYTAVPDEYVNLPLLLQRCSIHVLKQNGNIMKRGHHAMVTLGYERQRSSKAGRQWIYVKTNKNREEPQEEWTKV